MATDVSVVMAWRDMGDTYRRADFEYVSAWYERNGFHVTIDSGGEDFTRAKSLNAAIRKAPGDIIVHSDPDCLVTLAALSVAILEAKLEHGLVIPYDRWLYMNAEATDAVHAGAPLWSIGPEHCVEYGAKGNGGVTVFSRETWEQVGGFDERFGLWGGDDAAFAYAAEAFCSPTRRVSHSDLWHQWHPRLPQSFPDNPEYVTQFAILSEYRDAAAESPEAVRALVASL